MTGAGRALAAAAAALAVALVGACSASGGPVAPRAPAPVETGWRGCEHTGAFHDPDFQGDALPPTGGVPEGFSPTLVVLCRTETQTVTGDDSGVAGIESTSTEVASLVTYLARPDEAPGDEPCAADGWVRPWLVLVDAHGRFVLPAIPVDGCGKPLGWHDRDTEPLAWEKAAYTDRVIRVR